MAKITGLKRWERKLAAVPSAVRKGVRAELARIGDALVAAIRERVPEDTGELKASIGWTFGGTPKGRVKLGQAIADRGSLRITVFAGSKVAYYARFVEFGTAVNRAQPYFFVTWRAHRARIRNRVRGAAANAVASLR